MSAKKTAQGSEVRKIPFAFPLDFQPHWHPGDPALSQLINGTSISRSDVAGVRSVTHRV